MSRISGRQPEIIDITDREAEEVRDEVFYKIKTGVALICPCCAQHAFLNSRKITSTMARQLRYLAENGATDSKDLQQSTSGAERLYALLRFWGLIDKVGDEGDVWNITPAGLAFVEGRITVAKYAFVYNNRCLKLSQEQVTFAQASKAKFSLPEVFATSEHLTLS